MFLKTHCDAVVFLSISGPVFSVQYILNGTKKVYLNIIKAS